MAHGSVTKSTGEDRTVDRLVPEFEDLGSDNRWRVSELYMGLGAEPDLAVIVLPKPQDKTDFIPADILFNETGPYGKIKTGIRVKVYRVRSDSRTLVWTGNVVRPGFEWGERASNSLVVYAMDDRWFLKTVRVVGRFTTFDYQEGWDAHFNPGGRPNLLWDGDGNPCFAPHPDYGLEDGAPPRPASEKNVSQAAYWTFGTMLEYLQHRYDANAASQSDFPFLNKAPSTVVWPDGFGSTVDAEIQQNFDEGVGQGHGNVGTGRKGRDIIAQGIDVVTLITTILETAGGYGLGFQHADNGNCILRAVPTRYANAKSAVDMPVALGGAAKDNLKTAALTSGSYFEDGSDYISALAGTGQKAYLERRCEEKLSGDAPAGDTELMQAWHNDRWDNWLTLAAGNNVTIQVPKSVADDGTVTYEDVEITGKGAASEASLKQANEVFPEVLTCWRLRGGFDPQENTSQADFPWSEFSKPVRPTQLSMVSDGGLVQDFAAYFAPLYVEVNVTGEGWAKATDFNGMEVWEDGTIYMPQLRELIAEERVWDWSNDKWDVVDSKLDVARQPIRMNLAIPTDHALTNVVASAADSVGGGTGTIDRVIYAGNPDASRILGSLQRRDFKDFQDLYAFWERYDSYFRAASQGWPAADDEVLRNDDDIMIAHLKRGMWEQNRLRKGGFPRMDGWLVTAYKPGTAVRNFQILGADRSIPVRSVIAGIKLVCNEDEVYTEFQFI